MNTDTDCLDLWSGLHPAFHHTLTGETHLAVQADGLPAQTHNFTNLPEDWVVERDIHGEALALDIHVVAGYWRQSEFITLTPTLQLPLDG